MLAQLKRWARRRLPAFLRDYVRLVNGVRVVKGFSIDDWPVGRIVAALVEPGDVVVDAGANMGYITKLLAGMVGPQGRVVSVEPIPSTARILRKAITVLGLRQVVIHECALSSDPGRASMSIPHYDDGGENAYEARLTDSPGDHAGERRFEVDLNTLDLLLGDAAANTSFIKVDVEGHELQVVRGAVRTLAEARPALLIEVSGDPDDQTSPASTLFSELEARGYLPYHLQNGMLHVRQTGDQAVDYFFLQEDHRQRIAQVSLV